MRSAPSIRRNSKQLELGLPAVAMDHTTTPHFQQQQQHPDGARNCPSSPVFCKQRPVAASFDRGSADRGDNRHLGNPHGMLGIACSFFVFVHA